MDFKTFFICVMIQFIFIMHSTKAKPQECDPKKAKFKTEVKQHWSTNHTRTPFNPTWMDYCDPYHCNAYHKTACGLNRNTMRFKWFQSACHIILNNMCANYRGTLKYDWIDAKHCVAYVMMLRSKCDPCNDEVESPICAMSVTDYHAVMFKNKCALKMANCAPATLDEYKEIEMQVCTLFELLNIGVDYYRKEYSKIRS